MSYEFFAEQSALGYLTSAAARPRARKVMNRMDDPVYRAIKKERGDLLGHLHNANWFYFAEIDAAPSATPRYMIHKWDPGGGYSSVEGPLAMPELPPSPSTPLHEHGDGLIPRDDTPVRDTSRRRWLPFVLIGGGVLIAGSIVVLATRKKTAVTANRRRRRR